MKNMKKILALLVAVLMIVASVSVVMAEETYSITVNNPGANATINGHKFSAIKLFDVTYNGDAVSYKVADKTSNTFTKNSTAFAVLQKYFTFTPAASNANELAVTVGGSKNLTDITASDLYDMTAELNAIDGLFASATKAGTSENATNNTAVISLTEPGYYFVVGDGEGTEVASGETAPTLIAATALTTAKPQATIKAKLEGPTIDKKIDEGTTSGEGTYGTDDPSTDNHAVGDRVPFIVKGKVPDMTGYNKYFYIVTDTLSGGLTFNDTVGVNVKIDGKTIAQINEGRETKDQIGYTVYYKLHSAADTAYATTMPAGYKDGDELDVKIVFTNFIALKGTIADGANTYSGAYTGKDIIITYEATLNQEAVIGNAGNPNTVKLTFSNNPNKTPKGDNEPGSEDTDVTGTTPEKITVTYSTGVKLTKVDAADNTKLLAGATFEITGTKLNKVLTYADTFETAEEGYTGTVYYALKDGTYTTKSPVDSSILNASNRDEIQAKYKDKSGNTKYKAVKGAVTVKDTKQSVKAQATSGPDGVIFFDGLSEGEYTITEITAPNGYNLLKDPLRLKITWTAPTDNPITKTSECTWDKDTTGSDTDWSYNDATDRFEITVKNATGTELPSTGGMGTTILYIGGSILVILAAVLLITKRRMNAED